MSEPSAWGIYTLWPGDDVWCWSGIFSTEEAAREEAEMYFGATSKIVPLLHARRGPRGAGEGVGGQGARHLQPRTRLRDSVLPVRLEDIPQKVYQRLT